MRGGGGGVRERHELSGFSERGRRQRLGAERRRLEPQGQLTPGDCAACSKSTNIARRADSGRPRRRRQVRAASLWRSASRSPTPRPSRTSSRPAWARPTLRASRAIPSIPALTAGKRYVWRLRAEIERRVRAVVERDGVHDGRRQRRRPCRRPARCSTGPRPAGSAAGRAPAAA